MFNPGDTIQSKTSGRKAEIIGIQHTHAGIIYTAKWLDYADPKQNNNGIGHYHESVVKDEWKLVANNMQYVGMPFYVSTPHVGADGTTDVQSQINELMKVTPEQLGQMDKIGCEQGVHSWKTYNSGFNMFDYCEHCDKKKDDLC